MNSGDKAQPIWDSARVHEKTGVWPAQIVDWLSLVGDSVDNIEGVRGVGPKTAARLLATYGSLRGLYENLEGMQPEKLRNALAKARETVRRNVALITLKSDLTPCPEIRDCVVRSEERVNLFRLYETWGFRTMAGKYKTSLNQQAALL